MATLADVLKAIKDLITVTEKVRENTERIARLEEKVDTLHIDMVEMRGDIKAILNRLDMKEEISTLKVQLAEHILACEKAKA
jgi:GTP cyclohydrolase III